MKRLRSISAAAMTATLVSVSGCDTKEELEQQRLVTLKAEADGLEALKRDLGPLASNITTGSTLEGPGTVSIFLSKNLINSVLRGASGIAMPIPNLEGATITIRSINADLKPGFPLVNVDAEATNASLGVTVQLVGTARLETVIDPAAPTRLTLNVRLEQLLPRAQWSIFDVKIRGFVRGLIEANAAKKLSELATIKLPIATDFPLALPAQQLPVKFPGIKGVVNTPALSVRGHAAVSRVLVLPDGLHIYGTVTAKAAL